MKNQLPSTRTRPSSALSHQNSPLLAQPRQGSTWREARICLDLHDLSDAQRHTLANDWTQAGLHEHAAVASFQRQSLELLGLGAPVDLIREATQSALEEINHASLCFDIAAAYDDHPNDPGPLPVGSSLPLVTSLEELALATLGDGCIRATLLAVEADQRARRTGLSDIAAALGRLARDRTRHAEFAWRCLTWACIQLDKRAFEKLRRAFAQRQREYRDGARTVSAPAPSRSLTRHGYMSPEERLHLASCTFDDVLTPCFDDLHATLARSERFRSSDSAA